jgi:C4-dicarboxylate transporter DctM subunit
MHFGRLFDRYNDFVYRSYFDHQAVFDPIWFGVFLILMIELSQITPPVGFNLFVIQGLTGETIGTIAKAVFPFFLLMILTTILLTIFPEIALYLPSLIVK